MYLVLDQGGQSSRAALFDSSGNLLQLCQRPVATTYPKPGWVEQDPLRVVASLRECLEEIQLPSDTDIQAALVTQRSSLVCWDRISGEPLSPVLSWQDTRAADLLSQLVKDPKTIRRRTGLFPNAHFGASKMRWCLLNLPEVQHEADAGRLCIAPLSSFLLFHLCDQRPLKVDAANASRTMLYNIANGDWDPELLALFNIPKEALPPVKSSFADWGTLTVDNATAQIELVGGDQSAAFSLLGNDHSDAAVLNVGTGAFIGLPLPQGQKAPERLLQTLLLEEPEKRCFIAEGTVNGAGSALNQLANQLAITEELDLDKWYNESAERPLFLNGVGGLAAPFWQPEFESRFVEQGLASAEEKMVAVLESIAFLLNCNLQQIRQGSTVTHLRISGGLSQLDSLCQMLADLCQLSVHRLELSEATALGAAWLLAGRPNWPQQEEIFTPVVGSNMQERYQRWLHHMERAPCG